MTVWLALALGDHAELPALTASMRLPLIPGFHRYQGKAETSLCLSHAAKFILSLSFAPPNAEAGEE